MLKNYYRSAVRNMMKRKLYSVINISGLALGVTAFMLIVVFVANERSYDQFHTNKDQIFRIQEDLYYHGVLEEQMAGCGAAVGKDLKDNFPEIRRFVRLRRNQVMLAYGDVMFKEDRVFFASEDFFSMFSLRFVKFSQFFKEK